MTNDVPNVFNWTDQRKAQMNTLAHDQAAAIWWICLRPATTALAVGTILLSAVTAARSQEEEAPKPPAYTVLYTFTGRADGANPNTGGDAGLIRDREGNLYGTTTNGGDLSGCTFGYGCGVVFKLDPTGKETVLHTFTGPPDGADPYAGVIQDEEGNLYGTTVGGGSSGLPAGTVFKLDRAGKEIVLHSFTGGADGNTPYAGVIRDGNLYGTTLGGGSGSGVVFKLNPTGKETVLYSFTGGADGAQPVAGLVRAAGNFYGTASAGGASGNGVVFRLDRTGKFTVVHTFTGGTDGAIPYGRLFQGAGELYGTTFFGGDLSGCGGLGCGVVFKLDSAGKETVLHSFTGGADGANPYAGLIRDAAGNFYGTTGYGGDLTSPQPSCGGIGCGVVFKLKP